MKIFIIFNERFFYSFSLLTTMRRSPLWMYSNLTITYSYSNLPVVSFYILKLIFFNWKKKHIFSLLEKFTCLKNLADNSSFIFGPLQIIVHCQCNPTVLQSKLVSYLKHTSSARLGSYFDRRAQRILDLRNKIRS